MAPKTRPVITSRMKNRTPEEMDSSKKEAAEREAKWKTDMEERARKSVPDAIEKLRAEALLKTTEADRLDRLYKEFPDLVVKTAGRSPVVGQVFGYRTVVRYKGLREGREYWECLCQCGKSKFVQANALKTGKAKSCGCFRATRVTEYNEGRHEREALLSHQV